MIPRFCYLRVLRPLFFSLASGSTWKLMLYFSFRLSQCQMPSEWHRMRFFFFLKNCLEMFYLNFFRNTKLPFNIALGNPLIFFRYLPNNKSIKLHRRTLKFTRPVINIISPSPYFLCKRAKKAVKNCRGLIGRRNKFTVVVAGLGEKRKNWKKCENYASKIPTLQFF